MKFPFFYPTEGSICFYSSAINWKKSNITGLGQLKNSTDTLLTMFHHQNKEIRYNLKAEVGFNQFIERKKEII